MKKLRLVLTSLCLVAVLALAAPTTVFGLADDPQGGSNSTKSAPPPPPPMTLAEIIFWILVRR